MMGACTESHARVKGQHSTICVLRLFPGGTHQQPFANFKGLVVYLPVVFPVLVVGKPYNDIQTAKVNANVHAPKLLKGLLNGLNGGTIIRHVCNISLYTGLLRGHKGIHIRIVPVFGGIVEKLLYALSALLYHYLIYSKHIKPSAYCIQPLLSCKYGYFHPLHGTNPPRIIF